MKYEAQEASMQYSPEDETTLDYIESVYKNSQELIDADEIEDWEEGFMQGYAKA